MKRSYQILFLAGVFLAVMFWAAPAQIHAALPEGIKIDLVAEYPSNTPGIEKVQLMKFTFQPGAIIKNLRVENTDL